MQGSYNGSLRGSLVEDLVKRYDLNRFIETGSAGGDTTEFASRYFSSVHTIEASEKFFDCCRSRFSDVDSIECHLGRSQDVLPDLVGDSGEYRTLFWLDAHWVGGEDVPKFGTECPVIAELRIIGNMIDGDVVLIDDARLFTRIPPQPHDRGDWPTISEIRQVVSEWSSDYSIKIEGDVITISPKSKVEQYSLYRECSAISISRSILTFPPVDLLKSNNTGKLTAVAIGVARSGTSLVASVLDAIGFYMGDKGDLVRGGAFESSKFMDAGEADIIKNAIVENDLNHDLWGFKNPDAAGVLNKIVPELRNPHVVCIWRDPVAIAQHWWKLGYLSNGNPIRGDFWAAFKEIQRQMSVMQFILEQSQTPLLMMSYERTIADPVKAVRYLAEWLNVNPSIRQFDNAVSRIAHSGYVVDEESESAINLAMEKLP